MIWEGTNEQPAVGSNRPDLLWDLPCSLKKSLSSLNPNGESWTSQAPQERPPRASFSFQLSRVRTTVCQPWIQVSSHFEGPHTIYRYKRLSLSLEFLAGKNHQSPKPSLNCKGQILTITGKGCNVEEMWSSQKTIVNYFAVHWELTQHCKATIRQ